MDGARDRQVQIVDDRVELEIRTHPVAECVDDPTGLVAFADEPQVDRLLDAATHGAEQCGDQQRGRPRLGPYRAHPGRRYRGFVEHAEHGHAIDPRQQGGRQARRPAFD